MTSDRKRHSGCKCLSRRRFIGYASSMSITGLSYSPAVALFTTILGGLSQKAWAQANGLGEVKNLVNVLEGGAPNRCMFDNFLTPYSSNGFNRNPMVGSQFVNSGGRYIGVDYVTALRRGIQVPTMWTYDLPAPNSAFRPMANLLDNLLCIQGITTKNAGHTESQRWHWRPPGASQSTTAFSADASLAPLSALHVNANNYIFDSNASKTAFNVSEVGNMLSNLLDPFRPGGSVPFQTNLAALRQAYDGLLPAFDELARAGHPGAEAIAQNRSSALQLMETNFANLATEWTALEAKYVDLVGRAIFDPARPLAGLNDLPIGEGGTGSSLIYQVGGNSALNLHLSTDFRSAVDARTTVANLARRFAFTEYVIKNGLSSSVAFSIGSIGPFVRESDGVALENMGNDQHNTGVYPSTYFNILRHRAVAACLMELIEQLKAANLFNKTVISLSGEFNRNPRADLTGSDHGFTGKSVALYCGAFNGPLIVGNLTNDNRMGWGAGGAVTQLGRQLNLVDTSVTLAHLIGVPAPFTSATPVVTLGSNGLVSNIGTTLWV